jgi:hypothetical protein
MNLSFLSATRRAWGLVADPQHHAASRLAVPAAGVDAVVAALCLCVLGEWDDGVLSRWPPQSLDELTRSVSGMPRGMADSTLLLQQGLAAVDDLAMDETGVRFRQLDRSTQLRTLFQLESGLGGLSRRHARDFIDAFLTLAAQAYLRDALEPRPW